MTAKATHAKHAKARGLAIAPADVACCTIEALAASLLSQGLLVADSDVLDLFRLAGGDDEQGMPIRGALEAAAEFGLGGFRLARFGRLEYAPDLLDHGDDVHGLPAVGVADRPGMLEQFGLAGDDITRLAPVHLGQEPARDVGASGELPVKAGLVHAASLVLGVELPGQHTVLATPDGWWSWGELWCPCEFPDAVIDEAWAVTWAVAA